MQNDRITEEIRNKIAGHRNLSFGEIIREIEIEKRDRAHRTLYHDGLALGLPDAWKDYLDVLAMSIPKNILLEWIKTRRKRKKPSLDDDTHCDLSSDEKKQTLEMIRTLIMKYQKLKPGLASQHIYVLLKEFPGLSWFMSDPDHHETGWKAVDTFMGDDFHIRKQTYSSAINRFQSPKDKHDRMAVQDVKDAVEKDIDDILHKQLVGK